MAICNCGHHEHTHDPECTGLDEDYYRCRCHKFDAYYRMVRSDDSTRQLNRRRWRTVIDVELPKADGED